jgi:formylglycine-generating enzyme required for sulfatase activity
MGDKAMAFAIICKCGKKLKVSADHAGKRGKCPACGNVFTIPAAPGERSERPSPEPARAQLASSPVATAPTVDIEHRTVAPKPARRWPLYVGSSAAVVLLALAAFMFTMHGGGSKHPSSEVAAAQASALTLQPESQQNAAAESEPLERPQSKTEDGTAASPPGNPGIQSQTIVNAEANATRTIDYARVPKTITLDCGGGREMELVLIPAGEFVMGSTVEEEGRFEDEGPVTSVKLTKPFYMGVFEVTNEQYTEFQKEFGGTTIVGFNDFQGGELSRYPCIGRNWTDAVAFCIWLGKRNGQFVRLPTEAEWDYACRCGHKRKYPWGDEFPPKVVVANLADDAAAQRFGEQPSMIKGYDDGNAYGAPVGSYKPNRWGLYDMEGNVLEWCHDWYADKLPGGDVLDPKGPTEEDSTKSKDGTTLHVVKGGSCLHGSKEWLRCAVRHSMPTEIDGYTDALTIGFRVVCDVR